MIADGRRRAGKKAKRKGNNFERRVAKMLAEWWGSEFHRTPMSGGSQLAAGFDFAGDVVTNDPTFPFHVEAKNQEGWHVAQVFVSDGCKPFKFWDQACSEAPDSRIPLVIMTRNHHPIWGIVSYDTFEVLKRGSASHHVNHMDVVRSDGEHLVIFLITELFNTAPDIWRNAEVRMTTQNSCQPYPGRTGHRVELWIDAYWRTGELNVDPFEGAILKISEGDDGYLTTDRHAWAVSQLKKLVDQGKGYQYYHFGRPDTPGPGGGPVADAKDEAEAFISAINRCLTPHILTYADGGIASVWLDLEKSADNLSQEDCLAWILTFFSVVEKAGFPCGLYTSDSWLSSEATPTGDDSLKLLFWRQDGSRRPMWVARYGPNDGEAHLNKYPHEEKVPEYLLQQGCVAIKQFTSKMVTEGIKDPHDANLVYLV